MTAATGRPTGEATPCAPAGAASHAIANRRQAPATVSCLVAGRLSSSRREQSMYRSPWRSAFEVPRDHADGVVDQRFRGDAVMGQRMRLRGGELDDSMHE